MLRTHHNTRSPQIPVTSTRELGADSHTSLDIFRLPHQHGRLPYPPYVLTFWIFRDRLSIQDFPIISAAECLFPRHLIWPCGATCCRTIMIQMFWNTLSLVGQSIMYPQWNQTSLPAITVQLTPLLLMLTVLSAKR